MLFNSLQFAVFLPITFSLYWFVIKRNAKSQNFFLLASSYFFYGCLDWRFLFLIVFTTVCSFYSGLLIEKHRDSTKYAKSISVFNIVVNLLILGVFKYYYFFVSSVASIFPNLATDNLLLDIILPVGISFYTFSSLSYSIDVFQKKIPPTHDYFLLATYVSFFPQLLSGPIGRSTYLFPQYSKTRTFSFEDGIDGICRFLWGLFKKVVVADSCAVYVNQVWSEYQAYSGSTLLLAAVLFTIQIYGDFSGYSDMAIGVAKLFGINLKNNFAVPYFSRDIAEFWRRWHISLTTWFRDYVYIPMGGSRCSLRKVIRNTIVVFLVSGLWHGSNWTFVVWGAYNALLFIPILLLGKRNSHKGIVASDKVFPSFVEVGQMLMTFVLVTMGWIIFRADSLSQVWAYIEALFNVSLFSLPFFFVGTKKALFFSLIMFLIEWIFRDKAYGIESLVSLKPWARIGVLYVLILVILEFAEGSQSFIYFQF